MPPRKGSRVPEQPKVHASQSKYEGVKPPDDKITFYGVQYTLAPKIGYMPMLDFAHAANGGASTDDRAGMAAMWEVLYRSFVKAPPCRRCDTCRGKPADKRKCVNRADGDGGPCGFCSACAGTEGDPDSCPQFDPGDWPAFHLATLDHAADEIDLWEVVQQVLEAVTARPTRRRSVSSESVLTDSPNSKAPSSSREPPGIEGLVSVDELTRARSTG